MKMTYNRFLNILSYLYNDSSLSGENKCKVLVYIANRTVTGDKSKRDPFQPLIIEAAVYDHLWSKRHIYGSRHDEFCREREEYAKNYIKSFDDREADTISRLVSMEHFIPQS